MSNSFNTSVKPEIEALEAKIDIVDAVVDNIRAVDVSVLTTLITTVDGVVDAIRATDVPALNTKLTTLDTVADNIRNIDVPNIQTNIDANETKIDTIDGIVDAIKINTDATPQNVRGSFIYRTHSTTSIDYQDVVNVTGHGKLLHIWIHCNATIGIDLLITIDGVAFNVLSQPGDDSYHPVIIDQSQAGLYLQFISAADVRNTLLNLEFDTSLLIQHLRTDSAGTITTQVIYQLDGF